MFYGLLPNRFGLRVVSLSGDHGVYFGTLFHFSDLLCGAKNSLWTDIGVCWLQRKIGMLSFLCFFFCIYVIERLSFGEIGLQTIF